MGKGGVEFISVAELIAAVERPVLAGIVLSASNPYFLLSPAFRQHWKTAALLFEHGTRDQQTING